MIKIKTLLSLAFGLATLTAAPSSATTSGPGSDQVSVTEAAVIYDAVCVKNTGGFAGSGVAQSASFAPAICLMEGRSFG